MRPVRKMAKEASTLERPVDCCYLQPQQSITSCQIHCSTVRSHTSRHSRDIVWGVSFSGRHGSMYALNFRQPAANIDIPRPQLHTGTPHTFCLTTTTFPCVLVDGKPGHSEMFNTGKRVMFNSCSIQENVA